MKIGLLVIIAAILIIIALFSLLFFSCIGCGTGFVFKIKEEDCKRINEKIHDLNFTLTDELLDFVMVEYGYPISGLKNGTLREFCKRYRNIEDCKSDVALYCMGK